MRIFAHVVLSMSTDRGAAPYTRVNNAQCLLENPRDWPITGKEDLSFRDWYAQTLVRTSLIARAGAVTIFIFLFFRAGPR